jgi:hypothetical protein
MTMTAVVLSQMVSIACPVYVPGDTSYPVPVVASCPTPVGGIVYHYDHEQLDLDAAAQLRRDADTIRRLESVASEHAQEWHPVLWIAVGALAGAGVAMAIQM